MIKLSLMCVCVRLCSHIVSSYSCVCTWCRFLCTNVSCQMCWFSQKILMHVRRRGDAIIHLCQHRFPYEVRKHSDAVVTGCCIANFWFHRMKTTRNSSNFTSKIVHFVGRCSLTFTPVVIHEISLIGNIKATKQTNPNSFAVLIKNRLISLVFGSATRIYV